MSTSDTQDLEKIHREVHEWLASLSPAEKVERLKATGILDRHGNLSARYGGDGEWTDGDGPQTTGSQSSPA
ncbi:MAG: hypothetical protein ACQEXJ_23655 [Myxococcota bacterium]